MTTPAIAFLDDATTPIEAVSSSGRILIIDDEPSVRALLKEILSDAYECRTASSAEEALTLLTDENFDVVLSDINMEGMSGLQLVPELQKISPDTVVVMVSAEQQIGTVIGALQAGTFDYIQKPFTLQKITFAVERAVEHHKLLAQKRAHENDLEQMVDERTRQLVFLANYDPLTSLPNRVLFEDRVAGALSLAKQNKKRVATLVLRLDRFKKMRDTLGHEVGAEVLRTVGGRLRESVPPGCTVARFENDEFGILVPQINESDEAVHIVDTIQASLNEPLSVHGHELYASACVGISLFPYDGFDVQTLVRAAAVALSRSVESGDNSYEFYAAGMNAKAIRRLSLENKLRHALERGELETYYQPKINFSTKKIVGMEALLRWNNPELGSVSPQEFIPVAEETGLIGKIGAWVLKTACRETKILLDEGFSLQVSVNLSVKQLIDSRLLENLRLTIDETGLPAGNLELEVTESSVMDNIESAIDTLRKIRATGVEISIDDFGTGFSSLSYLKRLPLDVLKIDRSFVSDINNNPKDSALVNAIISIAQKLDLKIVAEGVETDEQLEFLKSHGCDEWQGYLCSRPVPLSEFRKLLKNRSTIHLPIDPHNPIKTI